MAILLIEFQLVHADILECIFGDVHHWYDAYTCDIKSLDNENNKKIITAYSGEHKDHKSNKDVSVIHMRNLNVTFIPENIGLFFNLTSLIVRDSKLIKIRSKNFIGMSYVENMDLGGNKLITIPADAFTKLKKLRYIELSYNQIQEVPNGVFSNNPDLEIILFSNNKIKFIGSTVFDELYKLDQIKIEGNICLSKKYNQIKEINELKTDIDLKCKSPNDAIELKLMEIGTKISFELDEFKTSFTYCYS